MQEDFLVTLVFKRQRLLEALSQVNSSIALKLENSQDSELKISLRPLKSKKKKLLKRLELVDAMIAFELEDSQPPELNFSDEDLDLEEELQSPNELKLVPQRQSGRRKPARVRGVLAAAKKAVDQLSGPFDKNQLLDKLVEINAQFADKKISGPSIRNTLRLLLQAGEIKLTSEATATKCAKYIRVA
jgi:hypothetical protein